MSLNLFDALLLEHLACSLRIRDVIAMMGVCKEWRRVVTKKLRWFVRVREVSKNLTVSEAQELKFVELPRTIQVQNVETERFCVCTSEKLSAEVDFCFV